MKGAASGIGGDLARARIALDERGQKLGELEERTAAMMSSADNFSKHAHDVRERDKKVPILERSMSQKTLCCCCKDTGVTISCAKQKEVGLV